MYQAIVSYGTTRITTLFSTKGAALEWRRQRRLWKGFAPARIIIVFVG